ncbi:MAG: cupin domain-containing protein, partial [Hyphomicrobiales bacterium]|nr:cupin domain-containing protein [Hyphomicrobiales bacterium]
MPVDGSGNLTADDIIALLELEPHPEGGHFRETFRDAGEGNGRAHSTAIYFLLRSGERSHWHRVDAAELWHWYAGAPLDLQIADADGVNSTRLGTD